MSAGTIERDYILGTHDEELRRLGLQHRVWRAYALDAWRRAGVTAGDTVLDVGSGPGYAAIDLAEIVGDNGRVVAVDRSARFLAALRDSASARGLQQITAKELDLDRDELPAIAADAAWARWVFAFVRDPRELVRRVGGSLRKGGRFISHEYFDYSTWRFSEPSASFEGFVSTVMQTWRESGGEPDIGRRMPGWLEEAGFRITSVRPIIEVISPSDFFWQWPKAFVDVGLERLKSIGKIGESGAAAVRSEFEALEKREGIRMFTPAVLEIIAERV